MYNVLSDQHNLVYEFRDESALFATTDANFCEKNTLYIGVMNLGMKFVMISKIVFVHSPLFILLTRKWPHVLHDIWQNCELSRIKMRDESEICLQMFPIVEFCWQKMKLLKRDMTEATQDLMGRIGHIITD